MNEKIRLIALDLDGTLLRTDKTISSYTESILKECIRCGHILTVASGRALTSLPANIMTIPGLSYAITSNGVALHDLKDGGCRLYHAPMYRESALQVLALARMSGVTVETFVDGQPYADEAYVKDPMKFGATAIGAGYIKSTRIPVSDILSFAKDHADELDAIDFVTKSLPERDALLKRLEEIPGLYVTSSVPDLIEISREGGGKGNALKRLTEYLGMGPEQVMAFGNEENDLPMLLYAGEGVAVANSPDRVRLQVSAEALSNEEDGVARYLEEHLLRA